MSKDFYKTLGVDKSASAEELKIAFRTLAKKFHPDKNKGDAAAESRFKEINEAYDILKDPDKRAAYDRFGAAAFDGSMGGRAGGGNGGAGFNPSDFSGFSGAFSDIFEDMFGEFMGGRGGARGRPANGRGADLQYTLDITLEDAYRGKEAKIKIPINDTCDVCNGSGDSEGKSAATCETCDGQGRVRQQQGFFTIERTCPTCQGQGQVIKNPCRNCNGAGRTRKEKNLKARIPAGVEHGRRIRLSGEGEVGTRGGPRGDLYILLNVRPHKFFKRDGANLHCRVPISVTIAALGGEVDVPTIDGAGAKVKIPAGTQTGQQFRLRSKGMTVLNSESLGDAFIEIFVETPVNLDKKQEELLRALDKTISTGTGGKNSPQASGFFAKVKEFWEDLKE